MKSLSIVVHMYAEAIPAYAKLFTAQLSSLCYYPPKNCEVDFQVWTAESDQLTRYVCEMFSATYAAKGIRAVIRRRTLQKKELFRRAIGRNISAKECTADVMWFADGDYCLYDGCLDYIANFDFDAIKPAEMIFPTRYWNQISHAHGDAEIAEIIPGVMFLTDKRNYHKKRLKLGIGGLQIVPRAVALRGYLDNTKWTNPRIDETPFPDTDDDARFRHTLHSSVPADIPNLFRLRHTASSYESAESRKLRMNKKPRRGTELS